MTSLRDFLRHRWVRAALPILFIALLGGGLIATVYWTLYDPQWIAFLGGVLFAAALALASQASKTQWLIMRRTRQMERLRMQLAQETARTHSATEAARIAETRLRLLADALPTLILFVDQEERCLYHNRAVKNKTGLGTEQIFGLHLREILGSAYTHVAPHIGATLAGNPVEYEFDWTGTALPEKYAAHHIPYPPGQLPPRGFYLLLTATTTHAPQEKTAASPARAAEPVADMAGIAVSGEGGETLYLRSITDQLMGWDEPRAKLEHALNENQFLLFTQNKGMGQAASARFCSTHHLMTLRTTQRSSSSIMP